MSNRDQQQPQLPASAISDWLLMGVMGLFCLVPGVMLWWTMAGFAQHEDEQGNILEPGIAGRFELQRQQDRKPKLKRTLQDSAKEDFGFKDELVTAAAVAQVEWLGVSSTPRVLLGQDGWLFINEPAETVDEIRGAAPLDAGVMLDIVATLAFYHNFCRERHIPLLIILPPSKPSIYPEQLPPWLKHNPGKRRMDQFMAVVADRAPELPVIDLRPAILAEKELASQVYQLTDTHWTDHGAFAGYEAFMPRVRELVPGVRVLTKDDLEAEQEDRDYGGDLSIFLGLSGRMEEDLPRLHVKGAAAAVQEGTQRFEITGGSGDGPSLLMYRDSFAYRLTPYLDASFGSTVYRWPSAKGEPQGVIDLEHLEQSDPDILIIEFTERWFTINPDVMRIEKAAEKMGWEP